jgi:hypothetical protein
VIGLLPATNPITAERILKLTKKDKVRLWPLMLLDFIHAQTVQDENTEILTWKRNKINWDKKTTS